MLLLRSVQIATQNYSSVLPKVAIQTYVEGAAAGGPFSWPHQVEQQDVQGDSINIHLNVEWRPPHNPKLCFISFQYHKGWVWWCDCLSISKGLCEQWSGADFICRPAEINGTYLVT